MVRERVERNGQTPSASPSGLSVAELRQLISLMNGSDIEEITIEQEHAGLRLTLRKPAPLTLQSGAAGFDGDALDIAEQPAATGEPEPERTVDVKAPLVGIYRSTLKPGGKALAAAGDVVREGQVVAAIEALNVLNEVEVARAGRIKEILVGDGQPVEYGQVLLVIEPNPA